MGNIMSKIVKSSTRKDIYVLLGDKHKGKTSTIKEIYRILSIKYPNCIIPKDRKNVYEMRIKMKIKVKKEYVLVGIYSCGDDPSLITPSLDLFAKDNCNVIFCAENVIPNSVTVSQWANSNSYKMTPILQNIVDPKYQAKTNYKTAKDIITNKAHLL